LLNRLHNQSTISRDLATPARLQPPRIVLSLVVQNDLIRVTVTRDCSHGPVSILPLSSLWVQRSQLWRSLVGN
jgi:hypothetical protein